jgi:hypothetical protein
MNSKNLICTDFLFACPSFVSGAARAVDLGGTFDEYNSSATPDDADTQALWSDWAVVGQDMHLAIEKVTK